MKSLVCLEPGQWQYQDKEKPEAKAGETLLKIKCIGVCGTDLHAFQGNQPFFSYPRILGHEFSAEVIEINGDSHGLEAGDIVTTIPYISCGKCLACRKGITNCCTSIAVLGVHCDGAMQEYFTVPTNLLIKVNGLKNEEIALIECMAIGAHSVRRGAIKEGENVLVAGAGPIGIAALQFAKANGGNVTVIDINQERLEFCKEKYDVNIINVLEENVEERYSELTNGDMGDVVIDATGSAKAMVEAIQYCGHSGRLVYVGLNKGELSFLHTEIHKRELSVLCSRNATKEDFERVIECLENGKADCSSMITHHSRFEDVADNFEGWIDPKNGVIKAVIEMD